ncbi:MAG: hypothetical protein DRP97_04390 [Candidatus Latescibacterota bacterium]|nr:MAG: hypothetical protein DRP97_04390 [Candidatus Latescibacterota bacterium]
MATKKTNETTPDATPTETTTPEETTQNYTVTGITILHNGKRYNDGSTIALTATEAAQNPRFLRLLKEPEK